jgi:DinB superfamily
VRRLVSVADIVESMPAASPIPTLIAAIDENLSSAQDVTSGLSPGQFNWRTEPGRWSIAQCLTHMNIVNNTDLDAIEAAIADGKARGLTGTGPFRYGFLSNKFVASQDLPIKTKFKAPKNFVPPVEANLEDTAAEYTRIARELRRLVLASEGLDLARIKTRLGALPPPLRSIVKMPLGARFQLLVNHDRRHLWQAGEVRRHAMFPR